MKVKIVEGYNNIEIIIKCPAITNEIRKLEAHINSFTTEVPCIKNGETFLVDISDVLYFESVDKRTFLYTVTDVYDLSLKLYEIEEMLKNAGFVRTAKSQIINTYKITSLRPDFGSRLEVTMLSGEKLIVSRQYSPLLKERLGLK